MVTHFTWRTQSFSPVRTSAPQDRTKQYTDYHFVWFNIQLTKHTLIIMFQSVRSTYVTRVYAYHKLLPWRFHTLVTFSHSELICKVTSYLVNKLRTKLPWNHHKHTIRAILAKMHFFLPQASEIIPVTNEPISIPAKKTDWRVAPRKLRSQIRFHLRKGDKKVPFFKNVFASSTDT